MKVNAEFETGRRKMNSLSWADILRGGDWTHTLKPYELVSIGWFFNTRSNFARPFPQNRTVMPLDDDTGSAIRTESWDRGDMLQISSCGWSCT
jgi:hypothetical protein